MFIKKRAVFGQYGKIRIICNRLIGILLIVTLSVESNFCLLDILSPGMIMSLFFIGSVVGVRPLFVGGLDLDF